MNSPARWYPGYSVLVVSTIAFVATAPGQTFVISQFNQALRAAFALSELRFNVAYAVATIAASLPLVWAGRLTDRFGPRTMVAVWAAAFALACMLLAASLNAAMLFVGLFALRFLGQGALALASQHALAMWFHRRLGRVHGIKQVALFAIWIPFPPLAAMLGQSVGWRWAFVIMGAAVALVVVPLSLAFVRDRPEDIGLTMDNDPPEMMPDAGTEVAEVAARPATLFEPAFTLREATRTRAYWGIAATFFVSPLVGTAMLFDIQPLMASRGVAPASAAMIVSAWTLAMALMAWPAGQLTDRVGARHLIGAGAVGIAASAAVLWIAPGAKTAAAAMVVFAAGQSLIAAAGSAALARYFGRAHHGAIRSSVSRLGVIGTGLGPVATGLSVSLTGDYAAAFITFLILCLPLVVLAMMVRPPDRAPHA